MSRRLPRLRALYVEWQARRDGRRGVNSSIHRATRDVTGPTGWMWSSGWDQLGEHRDAYMRSFDPRVPPSIFVSERDRLRHNQPMPLVERCIEDHPQARSAGQPQVSESPSPAAATTSSSPEERQPPRARSAT